MFIKRLTIENIRILENEALEPSSGLNILYGDNAAGKTSALEAISVLSSLKSFRSTKLSELERHNQQGFMVAAIVNDGQGREVPLGVERAGGELTIKAEGRKLNRVSELAIRLPVQVIHPDSHQIVSGGPKQRRRFLDWGVFHVEHHFLEQWRRYEKTLRQRNAALRSGLGWSGVSAWDATISQTAEAIHRFRLAYLKDLQDILPDFTREISGTDTIEFEYHAGWDTSMNLDQVLEMFRDRDRRRGFTCAGPHRADLVFKVDAKQADKHISRGQQKMLVFALLLAQVVLFRQRTGRSCILLLDDLAAELDEHHRDRLLILLRDMEVQTFITCVAKDSIQSNLWNQSKLFHVEHGKIREVL